MKLETGSEEKFLEFIRNLGESHVALVSHTDLDGMTCPKIVSEVVNPKEIFFVNYTDLNETLVKSLLKKMDKWGGIPKAWKNHRAWINSWCRKTGTPLFNSLSNFQDHVTVWK